MADSGEIVEIEPPQRLALTWRHEIDPAMRAEGYSRLSYDIQQRGASVKLRVVHEMERPQSKLIEAVSDGWPMILSSLKSLLETGEPLDETSRWQAG